MFTLGSLIRGVKRKSRLRSEATCSFHPGQLSKVPFTSDAIPRPRSGHKIVCNEYYLLSYGGFNPDNNGTDHPLCYELWKFDLAKRAWDRLDVRHFPNALVSNSLVLCGKCLLVYGGTGIPFSQRCSNQLYFCDLTQEELRFVLVETTGDLPKPLYGQAVVVKDELLYTVGGTSGYLYFSEIHCLNMRTSVWEKVFVPRGRSDEPEGRYRHEVVLHENKLIVLGGGTSDVVYGFSVLPAFDLSLHKWIYMRTFPDLVNGMYPSARVFHSSVHLQDDETVCILGGYDGDLTTDDVWSLSLRTLRWRLVRNITYPFYFHSSCVTPSGKIYSFGGVKSPQEVHSEEIRSNTLLTGYIAVPRLAEISWETLVCFGRIAGMSMEQLVSYGVPHNFALRYHKDGL